MTLAISPALKRVVFRMSPLTTPREHQSAATSMREVITIEYIVLLMTDSHPAALTVLHRSLTDGTDKLAPVQGSRATGI